MIGRKFTPFKAVCQSAVVIDLEAKTSHPYDELNVKLETPGLQTPARYAEARAYLIVWPSGLAAQLVTRLAPDQLQPSLIEALYKQATHVKPWMQPGQRNRRVAT